ncbi:MAG TPA: hypothetical protein GX506_05085 [Firmicutes bacterium]|nr:hypothetical protein [Bacillota bacterium]
MGNCESLKPTPADQVVLDLVLGRDQRTAGMMPGWDLELARQKTLFFVSPEDFLRHLKTVISSLDREFQSAGIELRERCLAYVVGIADSLNSVVELSHNLRSSQLHGQGCLSDADLDEAKAEAKEAALRWENMAKDAARAFLLKTKRDDLAPNKGDNLFYGWAVDWQARTGKDPYGTIEDFLSCFAELYAPSMYYTALFLAREAGKTDTQFFNDYGLQAARCRKIGSLGGTTNPVIAVSGEDDMDGIKNIWGEEATAFIKGFPNPWKEVRRIIAREQVKLGMPDDWAATKFTEWVVVDAMLGLRSVFLLRGLGRVAFQLRPDWHDDEEKLTYAGGEIYETLGKRVKVFDDILLQGAESLYVSLAAPRIGKANNHFKIACTGRAALNVVRAFNAGYHPGYPDALKERMFTNMTLSYEVPQMVAASLATEEGIRDYEKRTGQKVDDGIGGSVVTSMIGRFNDAVRLYRVTKLLEALPATNPLKEKINPGEIKSLTDPKLNNPEFIDAMRKAGIDFDPVGEEDAIDHAATLLTKRTVLLLKSRYGLKRTRILTASKRKFHQNTDLLGVPFSTDFGNIQRMSIDLWKKGELNITNWNTLLEGMNPDGTPAADSVWAKREEILRRIWPDWSKVYDPDGLKPEDYANMIYVQPTLKQFLGFWSENVARAQKAREQEGWR